MVNPRKPIQNIRVALLIETSTKIGRDFLQGIRNYAHEQGAWDLDLQPGGLNQVMPDLKTWKGTGLIARAAHPGLFRAIIKSGLPTVFFTLSDAQRKAVAKTTLPEVFVDPEAVALSAIHHLRDRGLQNLAYVGNHTDWSRRREKAFTSQLGRELLSAQIFPSSPEFIKNGPLERRALIKWLKTLPKPVGIMAANDVRGVQVLDAARQAGLSIPEEVAVVGVDNDELICSLCHPSLSSIELATVQAGYGAARALHGQILQHSTSLRKLPIPVTHIIPRESTATAIAPDWRVEKARRFIFQRAHKILQVQDLVDHVGVSRRTLEMHFAQALGHSILREMTRVRIEQIKSLLLSSVQPINQIALLGGYANANYMGKAFKKEVGCSPQNYRNQALGSGRYRKGIKTVGIVDADQVSHAMIRQVGD